MELAEQATIPDPGPGEVRIKVLAAGTGFTDTFIRRGRYPDFKGPLPFTPGYDLVGIVEKARPRCGRAAARVRWWPICASSAATPNTRSGRRGSWCPSPMASIRPRRCASRWPT